MAVAVVAAGTTTAAGATTARETTAPETTAPETTAPSRTLAATTTAAARMRTPQRVSAPSRDVANEGWMHVSEGSVIDYVAEPPASGPHYSVWATWDVHFELARGYWVHNVEHGGIVLLQRPDAPDEVAQALRAAFDAIPTDPACADEHKRALLAEDSALTTPVAVIAADKSMSGACFDENSQQAILDFVAARRGMGAEDICDQGTIQ